MAESWVALTIIRERFRPVSISISSSIIEMTDFASSRDQFQTSYHSSCFQTRMMASRWKSAKSQLA